MKHPPICLLGITEVPDPMVQLERGLIKVGLPAYTRADLQPLPTLVAKCAGNSSRSEMQPVRISVQDRQGKAVLRVPLLCLSQHDVFRN